MLKKCVVSKLNIFINVSKNHIFGEFCSKIRKERNLLLLMLVFKTQYCMTCSCTLITQTTCPGKARPALFHVDNKMIRNEKKTKAMLATGQWIEKRMNNQ